MSLLVCIYLHVMAHSDWSRQRPGPVQDTKQPVWYHVEMFTLVRDRDDDQELLFPIVLAQFLIPMQCEYTIAFYCEGSICNHKEFSVTMPWVNWDRFIRNVSKWWSLLGSYFSVWKILKNSYFKYSPMPLGSYYAGEFQWGHLVLGCLPLTLHPENDPLSGSRSELRH